MSILREFSKDAFIYGFGRGLKKFIGLFLLPFYTRALSPAEYGILGTLGAGMMFITAFFDLGLDSASGFYFFQAKNKVDKGRILYTILVFRLITIIPSLILSFFSKDISIILFGNDNYTWVVFFSCITIPIGLILSEQEHIYRYFRKPWNYNFVTLLNSLIGIGSGISLVVILKFGVLGAQISKFITGLIVVSFSILYFSRKIYIYQFSWYWAKKMLKYGFPLIWAGISTWVYTSSDRFFLLHYKSLAEIGYYSIGATFSQPLLLLNMAFQMSYGVIFFEIYNKETNPYKPETKKAASDILNLFLTAGISISMFLSIFSVNLIELVATKDYVLGALAIPFLTFSMIAAQAQQQVSVGISISEKTWHFTWLIFVTALLNLGLNFYFIPKFSFSGAAFTTLIANFVYLVMVYIIAQRYFSIKYNGFPILIYFGGGLFISIAIPYLELLWNVKINLLIKSSLFILGMILPLLVGIYGFKDITKILNYIKKKIL